MTKPLAERDSIKDLISLKEAYAKRVKKFGKEALREEFKEFFDAAPDVESIKWTQYTPGFNDGDPCTFSLGEVQYRTKKIAEIANDERDPEDDEEDWEDEGDGYSILWTYSGNKDKNLSDKSYSKLKELNELLENAEDVLEAIFGDGVEVTATPEEITTEDYDCGY